MFIAVSIVLALFAVFAMLAFADHRRTERDRAYIEDAVARYRAARLPEVPRRVHGGGMPISLGRSRLRRGSRGSDLAVAAAWSTDTFDSSSHHDCGGDFGGGGFDGGGGGGGWGD